VSSGREPLELLGLLLAGSLPPAAYLALGLPLLHPLRLRAGTLESLALAYLLGSGVASLAILALRSLDLPVPLWALALLAAAGPALARRTRAPTAHAPRPGWVRTVDLASALLAGLTFAAALGPESYWDGFEYHLPMVAAWCEGPIRALPGVLDAELRTGVDLLYVPAVAAGQPDAAASISAGFAVALAVLIRAEAARRGAGAGAAALAAFFALCVPFTRDNAPSSYVDLGVGAYGYLALWLADRWNREGDTRQLLGCALCLGFAANAKLHAAALVPAVAALLWLGGRAPAARQLLAPTALLALICAPWGVKAWLGTGNPFFPLATGWLGSGPFSEGHLSLRRYRLSTDFRSGAGPGRPLHYLASLAFGSNPHLSGLLGPLPFALLPAAIHRLARPTAALTGVALALFALQLTFMPALRFAAPLLPWLAIASAVGGSRLARSSRFAARSLTAVIALLALHHTAALAASYLPRLASLRAPAVYAERVFPDQVALAAIVERGRGVVAIPRGAVLWMPRPVYLLNWERNGELFFDAVRGQRTPPAAALSLLHRRGVESLVLDLPRARSRGPRTGHPTVDAWIASGDAAIRSDVRPLPARGERVWVLIELR